MFTPLYAGDRLAVRSETGAITLRLGGPTPRTLTREDGPLRVEAPREPMTVSRNLLAWAGDFLLGSERQRDRRVALVTRGADLDAALLEARPCRLHAGPRILVLTWRGGVPPYAVALTPLEDAGSEGAASAGGLDVPAVRLPVTLAPGPHRVVVRDATGASIEGRILAVDSAPAPPARLSELEPGPLHETLVAVWLASQDEGTWALEAYQRVAGLEAGYRPAALVREALERGERPSAPITPE